MTIWLPDLSLSETKYLAIADAIAIAVADGRLQPGTPLPPQRELAYALGLALGTVTRAYAEAERRGLIEGQVGRGSFVRRRMSGTERERAYYRAAERPEVIDLGMNLPVPGPADARLGAALAALAREGHLAATFGRGVPAENPRHCAAGAKWLQRLGFDALAEETLVTVGGQHALLVAFMATTSPGDPVLVEPHSFPPVKQIARHLKLRLCPAPVDDEGLTPEGLDELCRKTNAKALYAMPTLQSPTTATMSTERRRRIADVARRRGLAIIEDDVYGHLPARRPPPLAAFAPERVLLVSGLSKSVAPWLRVGYLRVPEQFAGSARSAIAMSCWTPPALSAELASRWIEDGSADAMLAWQRREIRARQKIARKILGEHAGRSSLDGLHLWLRLPEGVGSEAFQTAAERRNVRVISSGMFAVGRDTVSAICLALGQPRTRELLRRGIEIIESLLRTGGSLEDGVV